MNANANEELLDFLETPDFSTNPNPGWLLNDFADDVWYLKTHFGKELYDSENDTWRSPHAIYWNIRLRHGRLTDSTYVDTLNEVKRLTYLARSGPCGFTDNSGYQRQFAQSLLLLLRFGELEGLGSLPEMLRFKNFTKAHVNLFIERCVGGIPEILQLPSRLDSVLQELHSASKLHEVSHAGGAPNFEALASRLGVSPQQIDTIPDIDLFLAPYDIGEPKAKADSREHRDYRTAPGQLSGERPSRTSIETWLTAWRELFRQSPYIDGGLDFDPFAGTSASGLAGELGRAKARTPSIPRHVALHLLDHAIRWVEAYGAALIDYHEALEGEMARLTAGRTARFDYYAPQVYERVMQPESLQELNIVRYRAYQWGTPWTTRRKEKSMRDAIRALIGACAIIIGTFTARRGEELLALRRDSLFGQSGEYKLRIYAEKITGHAPTEPLDRPIPDVAATAFGLLQRLSAHGEPWLFGLPKALGGTLTMVTLRNIFAIFGDLTETPLLHEQGIPYRWYLRSHELRRFFAMAFFWHRPDASLDALSWFLGHLNRDDTLRYIHESVGGTEMAEEEAKYTMYSLRTGGANIEGMEELTRDIAAQFSAESVEMIPDNQLEIFLQQLHEMGALSVKLIESPEATTDSSIAICYEVT